MTPPSLHTFSGLRRKLCALGCLLALSAPGEAQDAVRASISRARDAGGSLNRPYNLKLGPVSFSASAGLGIEYIDNVNLTSNEADAVGDLIFRPSVNVQAVWQATKLNSLQLTAGITYLKFLENPELDAQALQFSPDTAIQFNLFVGDVKIVFREQFSLQQDPVNVGGAANVAALGRFINNAGVTALWDLNDVIWSIGYNRFDLITTGQAATTEGDLSNNLSVLDRASDQLSTSVFLKLAPTLGFGLEGTASYNRFPNNPRADSTVYSLGPFVDVQLTRYTRLIFAGGYQLYSAQNGDEPGNPPAFNDQGVPGAGGIPGIPGFGIQAPVSSAPRNSADGSGYYLTLAITHRLNRFYSDRLSLGRDFQIGVLADRTETTFINYTSTWQLTRSLTLNAGLSYERVKQTSQFARAFGGNTLPDFDRIAVNLSTNYQLTRKLNIGVVYDFVTRTTDSEILDFTQNRFAVQFGYQF